MLNSAKSKLCMDNKLLPKCIICGLLFISIVIYNLYYWLHFDFAPLFPYIIPRIIDTIFVFSFVLCSFIGFHKTNKFILSLFSIYLLWRVTFDIIVYNIGIYSILNIICSFACILPLILDFILRNSSKTTALIIVKNLSAIIVFLCAIIVIIRDFNAYISVLRWIRFNGFSEIEDAIRFSVSQIARLLYFFPFLEFSVVIFLLFLNVRKNDNNEVQVSPLMNHQSQFTPFDASALYSSEPVVNAPVNTHIDTHFEPCFAPSHNTLYQDETQPVYSAPVNHVTPIVSVTPIAEPVTASAPVTSVYMQHQAQKPYDEVTIDALNPQPVTVAPVVGIPDPVDLAPEVYISELDSEETVGAPELRRPVVAPDLQHVVSPVLESFAVVEEAPVIEGAPIISSAPKREAYPGATEFPKSKFCAFCGAKLSGVGSFCTQCGKKIV